ncbi:MAG: hypothetical protein AUJ00_01475 [Gemmatimonadetes bacterium 13_1_40CM_3_70_6]|nr:MAG: hypothetical protein AUJ00_01475 [Gemmatimonadetes bacterium 13_1_40CM_3_70_6]
MLRLFANANYDFIKWRRWAYGLTAIMIVPGLVMLLSTRLNYSIEFTGGTRIQIATPKAKPVTTADLRAALDAGGLHGAEIQQYGADTAFQIRARLSAPAAGAGGTEETAQAVARALDARLGAGQYKIVHYEAVGPKVGKELQGKAFLAIFFSFIVTLVYLAIRFEWRFGLAAVLATFHDILTTVAFIKYLNLEVSLVVVGAVLTIVGYSPAQVPAAEPLRDPEPLDQRDTAALDPDARHHHGHDAGPGVPRRRGDPAVRPGDDVRHLHGHLLVDLHRGAGADAHREAVAGAGRARCPGLHRTRPGAGGAGGPAGAGQGVTCSSMPTATWGTGRSRRTGTPRSRARGRRA